MCSTPTNCHEARTAADIHTSTLLNLVSHVLEGLPNDLRIFYGVDILTGLGSGPVHSLIQWSMTDRIFARDEKIDSFVFD